MFSLSKGNNGKLNENLVKKSGSLSEKVEKRERAREDRHASLILILFYGFDCETMKIFY